MPDNLKCTVRFFALKYAWHTLGETISCSPIRNICTSNKRAVFSINLKKDIIPDLQLSRDDPVDSSTSLRKTKEYRKVARPKKKIERPVEAKTITESVKFKRNTKSKKLICERDNLTSEIYQEFNKIAFDSLLPRDLRISWSNRLRSTAGITKMSCLVTGKVKVAEIVLSTKVVDDSDRLRSTLLHEMCHSAAWLVDGERKPPHGPEFWKWASISSAALPGMLVTTCHSYVIHKPYQFMCVDCKHSYGRHSRKGVDLERQCCGICKGKLNYMGVFDSNGKTKWKEPGTLELIMQMALLDVAMCIVLEESYVKRCVLRYQKEELKPANNTNGYPSYSSNVGHYYRKAVQKNISVELKCLRFVDVFKTFRYTLTWPLPFPIKLIVPFE